MNEEKELKNVDEPVRIYKIEVDASTKFSNNLKDWVWYTGFRLEILALFVNIPILKIWKRKAEIFADLSTFT